MRLFTALLPPDHVLDGAGQLADQVARLRSLDGTGRLRWAERANWHITLAFYGEVEERQLDGLSRRLARVARRAHPLRLRIAGGGRFGDRSLWAGVTGAPPESGEPHAAEAECAPALVRAGRAVRREEPEHGEHGQRGERGEHEEHGDAAHALRRLASAAAAAGRRAGLDMEEPRRFRAHLTLARARSRGPDLRPFAAALDGFAGEPWTAAELALIRSNPPTSGVPGEQPRYEQIAGWPLGG